MAITLDEVRANLQPEELDYPGAAERLGPEALPHLQQLAESPDVMIASKATYMASLIRGELAPRIIEAAGRRPEPAVRVAAATGLKNLHEHEAEPIVDRLLGDNDIGVRKMAVKSIGSFASPSMKTRLRQTAERDPEAHIRDLANRTLNK
jgi:HEAT repeat protein